MRVRGTSHSSIAGHLISAAARRSGLALTALLLSAAVAFAAGTLVQIQANGNLVSDSNPLPIKAEASAGTTDVNVAQVGGVAAISHGGVPGIGTYALDPATGVAVSMTNPVQVYSSNSYANITSNTTTTVKSGAGTLANICVNNAGTTEVLTIYDNTAGSGTKIGTAAGLTAGGCETFAVAFGTGLTIVSSGGGTGDWTIGYR